MVDGDAAERITSLWRAFLGLAEGRTDLKIRGGSGLRIAVLSRMPDSELVHPAFGFAVTLQPEPEGPGVDLHITGYWTRFVAWPTEDERKAGRRSVGGRLAVDLSDGYRWAALEFESAEPLARMLLLYMLTKSGRYHPTDPKLVEWAHGARERQPEA